MSSALPNYATISVLSTIKLTPKVTAKGRYEPTGIKMINAQNCSLSIQSVCAINDCCVYPLGIGVLTRRWAASITRRFKIVATDFVCFQINCLKNTNYKTHNCSKWRPLFKMLSLLDYQGNFARTSHKALIAFIAYYWERVQSLGTHFANCRHMVCGDISFTVFVGLSVTLSRKWLYMLSKGDEIRHR